MTEADPEHEQIARLQRQLYQAQKMEAVGQLAGGVAHDFNNLLTVIMSYSELVGRGLPPDSELQAFLDEIKKAAERASTLALQLLAFSRRESAEARVLDLNDLILDMDRLLRRLLGADVELVTLPASDLCFVKADAHQLEQVVVNLAINARDAMPDGGKVVIMTSNVDSCCGLCEMAEAHVMMTVRDDGVGMTEEVEVRVFERFFTTKEAGKGTGLGLATSQEIVTRAGGRITVESCPGQGTDFTVCLPRVEADKTSAPAGDASRSLPVGNETVLVVEDVGVVRTVVSRVLRDQGYTVLQAGNGDEAFNLVRQHPDTNIHLLLTDMVMPLMGGRELAKRLREANPGQRVFYISGYSEGNPVGSDLVNLDTPFMRKPFTTAELAVKVREVLDSPQM